MLGMPVITATAGFIPSTVIMLLCCVFMYITGLLLLEATLWFQEDVNLLSLARHTLGTPGQIITWGCFVFLFYCLCVAYTIGCGEILGPLFQSETLGAAVALTFVGILIYAGTRTVDYLNRGLMVGLIITYCLLVASGASYVDTSNLQITHWDASLASIPLLLISFGYQNLVPSMTHYLRRDVRKIRISMALGMALTFVIYVIWETVILGILPASGESVQTVMDKGQMVTELLQNTSRIPYIIPLSKGFALFAITTSLLANSLTCVHFLHDGLRRYVGKTNHVALIIATLLPPFIIAVLDPNSFLSALSIAGGTATVIIFGILPAVVVWHGRYKENRPGQILGGGKTALILVIAFSSLVLGLEIARQLGVY
jgi:tyrosine-specific transport protein